MPAHRVFEDPDFWVYYQPITLYNVLAARQPLFLKRNLKYARKPPAPPKPK
jgi:hypothetical protein